MDVEVTVAEGAQDINSHQFHTQLRYLISQFPKGARIGSPTLS